MSSPVSFTSCNRFAALIDNDGSFQTSGSSKDQEEVLEDKPKEASDKVAPKSSFFTTEENADSLADKEPFDLLRAKSLIHIETKDKRTDPNRGSLSSVPSSSSDMKEKVPKNESGFGSSSLCKGKGDAKKVNSSKGFSNRAVSDPRLIPYNMKLAHHARNGSFDAVFQVLNEIESANLEPDVFSFSTLLKVCFSLGDAERAQTVFNSMLKKGIAPNLTIYDSLINGFTKTKRFDLLDDVLSKMGRDEVRLDNIAGYNLIHSLVERGEIEIAKRNFLKFFPLDIKKHKDLDDLDLHELSYGAAYAKILCYLDIKKDKQPFFLVTGKGNKSKHGQPFAMRNYIYEKLTKEHHLICRVAFKNTGVLIVSFKDSHNEIR